MNHMDRHMKCCCCRKKHKFNKLFLNSSGEGYVELVIILIITILLIYSLIELLPVFIKKQHLDYMTQSLARIIEITGSKEDAFTDELNRLKAETGLDPSIHIEGNFIENKIQLREKFAITLQDYVSIKLIDPSFAPPVEIRIPISRTVTGISEVYWKFTGGETD